MASSSRQNCESLDQLRFRFFRSDPESVAVNSFTFNWGKNVIFHFPYSFAFSVLQKI